MSGQLEAGLIKEALTDLNQDGVIRLDNLISADLCQACLNRINESLAKAVSTGNDLYSEASETGFGNVYERNHRWDMYLPYEGVYKELLKSLLGDSCSPLNILFDGLFSHQDAEMYELSSLICDDDANSQPIHPDTQYQEQCPLYTVFVALQDVDEGMGPTIFLPGTQNNDSHTQLFSKNVLEKDTFLAQSQYKQALLKCGDVVIMDSRTLHCGHANWTSRRILLYFTFRNPLFYDSNPPRGSKFSDLKLNLHDILNAEKAF